MAYLGDFSAGTPGGRIVRAALSTNENADLLLAQARDMLVQMRTGDGSSDAHYTDIVKFLQYGGYSSVQGDPTTAQLQLARASFEEIDSAYGKTSGDGTVSNVRTARQQLYNKHRG